VPTAMQMQQHTKSNTSLQNRRQPKLRSRDYRSTVS